MMPVAFGAAAQFYFGEARLVNSGFLELKAERHCGFGHYVFFAGILSSMSRASLDWHDS